jgi:hypothetical protein
MANVVDLEAMLPLLPNCLLVLTLPQPQAAALVADGAISDAVWMAGGQGLLGDTAARALIDAREGKLTAYRIDDPRMSAVLRTLLADPAALVVAAGEVDVPPAPATDPATDPEVTAAADQPEGGGEAGAPAPPPTFDLAFAYVGLPDRESSTANTVDAPAPPPEVPAQTEPSRWSPRQVVTPPAQPHLQSSLGPVGVVRSPLEVAVRVPATLGLYALSWQKHSNLELEAFDASLPRRKPRSTTSSVLAWLLALVIAVAGAVLFVSTRQSIHLPFGRQLTTTEAYYLIGGLACLYLIVILPFNMAAATVNLRRIRQVQQRAGVDAGGLVSLAIARLMVIPVIGRLVLIGLEQRAINTIWNSVRIADAPGVDVVVDRSPALEGEPAGADTTAASAELPDSSDAIAASDTAPPSTDAAATESSEELAAIFSEMQSQPEWMRIAAPKPEDAAPSEPTAGADTGVSATAMVMDDVAGSDVEPAESAEPALSVVPAEPDPEPAAADEAALSTVAAEPDDPVLSIVASEPDQSASDDSTPRADPVWFHVPTPPADEVAEPGAAADAEEPQSDFVAPRLDIDIDALRHGLNQIAVKWLGADDVAPVAAAIAAARPGVDDFVAAIAAIRAMEIPGRESPIVRAMAREMHYYATEVLCAA